MNDDLRRQDDEKIEELEQRFDRHLEIYANNGKEMARLAVAVENMHDTIINHTNEEDKTKKQVDEMYIWFSGLMVSTRWGDSFIKYIFAIIIGTGSLILLYKQIIK